MQAIILAAGMGKRLGEFTRDNTKCMVPVNGVMLIDRLMSQLSDSGIKKAVIVIGYKGKELAEHLGNNFRGVDITYVLNNIYDKTNNIYSLSLARDYLGSDDSILVESDIIVENGMLSMLLDNPSPNLALVAKYQPWMDGTMVRIDDEKNIVDFITKAAFNYKDIDSYYKTVNIYKFSKEFCKEKYIPFLDAYTKAVGTNEYYENVLRIISFLNSQELKALPVGDRRWYEIDDKQDLDIAEALFADEEHIIRKYYGRFGGFWRFPQMLDFCYLVNPFFPTERMVDEMQSNFKTLLTEYPSGMKVNTLLASKCWGVKEEYIVPGNGAAELIMHLMTLCKGKVGVVRPTFEEYPNRLDSKRLVTFIPQNRDFRYTATDLIEFFTQNPVENIILINPDNPSGNYIRRTELAELAFWCNSKDIRLIEDESFLDFSEDWESGSMLDDGILEQFQNLVVIKSISKSFGVPGLRLGILASSDTNLISQLKRAVSIWNINSFAEYFMQIFSKYEGEYKKACQKFLNERNYFESKLREIPFLRIIPSQANYFLVEVLEPYKASDLVVQILKRDNILLRDCSGKTGLNGSQYLRIAVRSRDENDRLINALKNF